jgi:hypothetical protein
MTKFELTSTCDDAGNMLAGRIENAECVRVIESHDSREAAELARQDWLDWYESRGVAIGAGCLAVRAAE